jgi:hypothetical protein
MFRAGILYLNHDINLACWSIEHIILIMIYDLFYKIAWQNAKSERKKSILTFYVLNDHEGIHNESEDA